jgi:hypothetical protein
MIDSSATEIHVDEEVQRVLHENRVDVLEHLHSGGLDVQPAPSAYPEESPSGAKGAAMILLASAAAAPLVAEAIVRLVRGLTSARPLIVQEQTLIPTSDPDGRIVTDSHGEPILYWAQRHRVLEAPSASQATDTTQLTIQPTRFSISLGSTRTHGR